MYLMPSIGLYSTGVMDDDLMDELMEDPGDAAAHAKESQLKGNDRTEEYSSPQEGLAVEGK